MSRIIKKEKTIQNLVKDLDAVDRKRNCIIKKIMQFKNEEMPSLEYIKYGNRLISLSDININYPRFIKGISFVDVDKG